MESAASAAAITASMEDRAREIADFDAVVRVYWPRIFRFALASLRDRDAAETLAQDCFLKAYRARDRFRGEASLKTWLMQIAVNLARDRARSRRLQFWRQTSARALEPEAGRDWIPDSAVDPERRVLLAEQIDALWAATARLPERQRTVFLLRYVEEMELLEIAEATGLKEGAVKVHLYRALRRVRAEVGRLR